MIDLTYIYSNSLLHKTDPAIKFAGLIILSILILFLNGFACLITSVLIISVLQYFSRLNIKTVITPVRRLSWFFIMMFLVNALFYKENSCIYSIWAICLSKEGIIKGANILLHTSAVTILSYIFIRTTTSVEIMKGIEKLMTPLKFIGIPTRDIALIMSIALQFIPVFYTDFEQIRKAQIARGADLTGNSLKDKIKFIFPLVIPAFVSAFRRADELSLAMEARGFSLQTDADSAKEA